MTGRDGFALAIRIGGGWEILQSLDDLYYVVVKLLHLPTHSDLPMQVDIDSLVFRLAVGVLVIASADVLAAVSYGGKPKPAT
jgi:hypothetical protein